MYHLFVCDDVPEHAAVAGELAAALPFADILNISTYHTAAALLAAVSSGNTCDILLMDIELGGENGIDIVKQLHEKSRGTQVIYATGYDGYHSDVYETEHIYFLQKPIDAEKLERALRRAVTALEDADSHILSLKTGNRFEEVRVDDIIYIESRARKLCIFSVDGNYEVYGTLDAFLAKLGAGFVRCHKSFAVNAVYVRGFDAASITLRDGAVIPVSRKYWGAARAELTGLAVAKR
jgi:DNA-binding LytR/AlgR family response regulator